MISKKLESLKKEFIKTKGLSSLLIFLEEALKEKMKRDLEEKGYVNRVNYEKQN